MSEDKSIDELINLAVSCGAGLYRNTCNAEVLTSFTQHELRVFYKAAQAAMQPEITHDEWYAKCNQLAQANERLNEKAVEVLGLRNDRIISDAKVEQLQAKVAEAKREALEEAAVIAQTNSDSNVDGGDYACGCCYEIRRMAADLRKRHSKGE